jgi:hypothetical protein
VLEGTPHTVEPPLDLGLAARFLPLVAGSDEYDEWAKRWLARWLSESRPRSIDAAAELAALLADGRISRPP